MQDNINICIKALLYEHFIRIALYLNAALYFIDKSFYDIEYCNSHSSATSWYLWDV